MRLIDADELIFLEVFDENDKPVGVQFVPAEFINNAPTIEAEPRMHGRWIDRGKDMCIRWKCSECGRKDTHIYNYCPNCGAKMDEEAN